PHRIASGTTLEIPIVTPPPAVREPPAAVNEPSTAVSDTPPAVSEPKKQARTADRPSIENSSPPPPSGPGTDSLSATRAQALDILRVYDAPPAQQQSRSTETTTTSRVEAFVGIWAREPAECRNWAADDARIRIDARSAESGGVRCAFRS